LTRQVEETTGVGVRVGVEVGIGVPPPTLATKLVTLVPVRL
jgi:hypothetical protein